MALVVIHTASPNNIGSSQQIGYHAPVGKLVPVTLLGAVEISGSRLRSVLVCEMAIIDYFQPLLGRLSKLPASRHSCRQRLLRPDHMHQLTTGN